MHRAPAARDKNSATLWHRKLAKQNKVANASITATCEHVELKTERK